MATLKLRVQDADGTIRAITVECGCGALVCDGDGGWITSVIPGHEFKASDQQVTVAGWVDVSGLTFPVAANKAYLIEAYLVFQTSVLTCGIYLGVSGPAAPGLISLRSRKEITPVANASTDKFNEAVVTAYDTANPVVGSEQAANTNLLHEFSGVFVNGPNAGTFALRVSKENVAGVGLVKAGSWLRHTLLN